ncbi:MAG TPA: xanthine dehydrogenase family protein subunit M [Rubrivivax sp.]|nr:xanthine dehydrogenase family protein subunit M [Rubrivivax sp.]
MTPFAFHRPASQAAALQLHRAGGDARYLAGGQSLLPTMKLGLAAPSDLIDLSLLPGANAIAVEADALRIGAMTPHAVVAASAEVRRYIPALAALAEGIGDPAVRTRGTIGGSLAQNDPAACCPAAVLGLGATVLTDRRRIAADDFFKGLYETALEPGELITALSFPIPQRAAYVKFKQPASRFALVGVFVSQGPDPRSSTRVAVTGAGPCVFRVGAFEAALAKDWSAQALAGLAVPADGLNTDLHAGAAYRAHLIGVLARRAVAAA